MSEISIKVNISVLKPPRTADLTLTTRRGHPEERIRGTLSDPNHEHPLRRLGLTPWLVLFQLSLRRDLDKERAYEQIGDMLGIKASTVETHALAGAETVRGAYGRQFNPPIINEAIEVLAARGLLEPEVMEQVDQHREDLRTLAKQQFTSEKDTQ